MKGPALTLLQAVVTRRSLSLWEAFTTIRTPIKDLQLTDFISARTIIALFITQAGLFSNLPNNTCLPNTS